MNVLIKEFNSVLHHITTYHSYSLSFNHLFEIILIKSVEQSGKLNVYFLKNQP